LSIENDDASAERMGRFLGEAGIDYARVLPWNAYPWYIISDPTTSQLQAGAGPLRELIGLMPRLRVVILHGTAADKGWKLLLYQDLGPIEQRGIVWLSTYHTSRQALQTPDRARPAGSQHPQRPRPGRISDAGACMAASPATTLIGGGRTEY
jgi:hypothetical protein